MRYTVRTKFENHEELYKEMYFELAKAVSNHAKSSKHLEETLNSTLELLHYSDIDKEIKKTLVNLVTY